MIKIRKDILGVEPNEGDTIVYNPPKYKGLIFGICIGFTEVGLPKVAELNYVPGNLKYNYGKKGFLVPKTGFVCKHKLNVFN